MASNREYLINGRIVPSVTEVLASAGLITLDFVTDLALTRGTYVHKAAELYDQNRLNHATVDPIVRPYLDAWIKFRKDTGAEMITIEEKIYSTKYYYGGRPDRIVQMDKKMILDLKTGEQFHPSGAIQMAAYLEAYNETAKEKARGRIIVQLMKDGSYKLPNKDYYGNNDFNTFLAALTIRNWKEKYGKNDKSIAH
jgi:hypothetical protein